MKDYQIITHASAISKGKCVVCSNKFGHWTEINGVEYCDDHLPGQYKISLHAWTAYPYILALEELIMARTDLKTIDDILNAI